MTSVKNILKTAGYSEKAITYYQTQVNVGVIKNADIQYAYTGPCGDTVELFLCVSDVISDAKFQVIGCVGTFIFGSALTEMIIGKKIEDCTNIDEDDLLKHMGQVPEPKRHCARLVANTFQKAIKTIN